MRWSDHQDPDPCEAFGKDVSYLTRVTDEHAVLIEFDDVTQHGWLETALAQDDTSRPVPIAEGQDAACISDV